MVTPLRDSDAAHELVTALWRHRTVEAFLAHEARLLDERRFAEWEALWTDDAVYWVPAEHEEYDPTARVSLIYDDRATLAKRVERLTGPDSHAERPPPRVRRTVSNTEIVDERGGELVVESNFVAVSHRRAREETWGGRSTHHLVPTGEHAFVISYKKVVLVNCDAFLTHLPFLP